MTGKLLSRSFLDDDRRSIGEQIGGAGEDCRRGEAYAHDCIRTQALALLDHARRGLGTGLGHRTGVLRSLAAHQVTKPSYDVAPDIPDRIVFPRISPLTSLTLIPGRSLVVATNVSLSPSLPNGQIGLLDYLFARIPR